MLNEYIQSAKTELERLQKQGNTAANSTLTSNEPTTGTRAATRPFLAKKKATPFYRCRHTERSKELLEQFLFLLSILKPLTLSTKLLTPKHLSSFKYFC